MTRRLAMFLTPIVLLAGVGVASAQNAAAIVQQIHDEAYGKCMEAGRFGAGAELQGNCSCSADVAMNLLSDEFKQAIADGTQTGFKGQKLIGDEMSRNVALVRTCPKVGAYLQQQCAGTPDNPHCQVLQRALEQAQ
jgi:hypothetical protein